jgi:hypothetical protein
VTREGPDGEPFPAPERVDRVPVAEDDPDPCRRRAGLLDAPRDRADLRDPVQGGADDAVAALISESCRFVTAADIDLSGGFVS